MRAVIASRNQVHTTSYAFIFKEKPDINLVCVELLVESQFSHFSQKNILDLAPLRQFINKLFLCSKAIRRQLLT